ncbi:MAG: hypothetical protein QXH32_07015 [Candidatus Caldarchaeum sp.]
MIALANGPKTPKQISEDTKLYLSHVSCIINDLLKRGVIECLTPNLRKGKIFSLSSDGKEIAKRLKKIEEVFYDR